MSKSPPLSRPRYGALFVCLLAVTLATLFALWPRHSLAQPYSLLRLARSSHVYDKLSPLLAPLFGPNVRANSDDMSNGQHEPSLAASRVDTNTVVIAAKDFRADNAKQVWIYSSTDGGSTWPASRQLRMPGLPGDVPNQSDPVAVARDDGRIYVSSLATNEPDRTRNGIFITWTDDGGLTWRPSVAVYYPDTVLDDKDWFAIDNNPDSPYYHNMYMTYAPNGENVVVQRSTDGGLTWSSRQQVGFNSTEYPYPVVGPDGAVYLFMMQNWGPGRTGNVQMTRSTDAGATWDAPATIAQAVQPGSPIRPTDEFRFFATISAAADPNTGALYVAWTDRRNSSTDGIEVLYVKGSPGGKSWSAPARLSHDSPGVVRDHITPVLHADKSSRLHAFWLDRRLDPSNRLFDSWYSSSTDAGATWDADTRVSTASQDLNVGLPPGSGNAAGDYWGLDAVSDTVYVAWNDSRSGQQDILVSRGLLRGDTSPTATPTVGECSTEFADVAPGSTFYPFVRCLACRNVLGGYPCGGVGEPCGSDNKPYFRPGRNISRGQISKIVSIAAGFDEEFGGQVFEDVPPGATFYPWIQRLALRGIMSGYACGGAGEPCTTPNNRPYFRPSHPASRGQLAKIVANAAGANETVPAGRQTYADVPPNSPFWLYIERLSSRSVMGGYPCGGASQPCDGEARPYFRPEADVTRAQAAKIVANTFFLGCDTAAR
ncbi:MAG: exo-alpha-sialidase [Chloroflexota bacterium]|nr:exo-alpha-sialidase [Chloroflexota bacterium]MDQ5867347.1 exo-alpha-sialidase [Chloroflexota bacterium]